MICNYCNQEPKTFAGGCSNCGAPKPGSGKDKELIKKKHWTLVPEDGYVLAKYMSKNKGNHYIYGAITNQKYRYGKSGDVLMVHERDIEAQPKLFKKIGEMK